MPADNAVSGFATKVLRFIEEVEYRRIRTPEDLDAVRKLRYDSYLRENWINPREDERLPDEFDEIPNASIIGLYLGGKLVSALRIHSLLKPGDNSPAMHSYPDFLEGKLAAGNRIVDCNRFVTDHVASRAHPELPYATVRLSVMGSVHFGAQLSTATVRVEHQAFYKRSFFAEPVSEPREYPNLTKPVLLMLVRFAENRERICARNPFYLSTEAERAALFGDPGVVKASRQATGVAA